MPNCFTEQSSGSIAIVAITCKGWNVWLSKQTLVIKQWLRRLDFVPKAGGTALLPNSVGKLNQVLLILNDELDFWSFGILPCVLPKGDYYFRDIKDEKFFHQAAIAWGLGAYEFTRYKKSTRALTKLFIPKKSIKLLNIKVSAIYRVRDLINTPAEDFGPAQLAETVVQVAQKFNAKVKQIIGDKLLKTNYTAIHAVGRASSRKPRLIELTWGNPKYPKITLVGKGVCFDSGGLNLKQGSSMSFMKKDMGGAANAIGLAEMIMSFNLPIRLRLLIPAVENLIGSLAYKPGDIIKMRNGLTVEISNTDAEGRLVLAEALYEADRENPELIIDLSTLTGAARSALGTEISAFFTRCETLANDLLKFSEEEQDPIWRLPLHTSYKKLLESKFADLSNSGTSFYAGAITAALFLSYFVREKTPWVHFDFNAYNVSSRPGRAEGGEAMAILTLLAYLQSKYFF